MSNEEFLKELMALGTSGDSEAESSTGEDDGIESD